MNEFCACSLTTHFNIVDNIVENIGEEGRDLVGCLFCFLSLHLSVSKSSFNNITLKHERDSWQRSGSQDFRSAIEKTDRLIDLDDKDY